MPRWLLKPHAALAGAGRIPAVPHVGEGIAGRELAALAAVGCTTAVVTAYFDMNLRIPGHAILRTVFPLAFGLALVPRYGAGSVMALATGATLGTMNFLGLAGFGVGATTSACLAGPMIDAALSRARRGPQLYLGIAGAGLATNLVAYAVRAVEKAANPQVASGGRLAVWWSSALASYAICGLVAGLISAAVWFRFGARTSDSRRDAGPP